MMGRLVDDLLDTGEGHARRSLLERRERKLLAFYHLVVPNYGPVLVPVTWQNDVQKQVAIAVLKEKARQLGAIAALFVGEAWMLRLKHRLDDHPRPLPLPRESPERIEVVGIGATDGADLKWRVLQIVRDKPGGRIVSLVTGDQDRGSPAMGNLLEGVIPR